MSNPKNAAEIVTDKDLDVVLKNTSFDSATFLRLYSEWKVTKDAHTFASLRKMHEDAGYNNKNLIFGAEQEMHEIAAIVQRYQAERNKVVSNTATATANTASTVGHAVTENNGAIPDVNPEKIKSLKTALENEANSPLTPDGLTKILERLKEEKNPDNRAVITSYIWSKMNHGGYITTIINDSISVEHVTDKIGATSLEKTLQAHISANILTLVDIQRAMIVGPESFRKYLNTQRVNIRSATTDGYVAFIMDARGINLTRATTLEQKLRIIQSSKATPDEKAFLVSYMNGGLRTYNIAPELDRQIKMDAIGAEIKASPEFKKTEKVVEVASGGAMKQEQDKREKDGKPKNLTLKELFDNPINAITTYPWSSVALIIGSIFAFGWKNTFMALLGVGIGMKAINEIADASGHPIGGSDGKKKDENEGQKNTPKSVQKMDHTIDISKKGPNEQKLWANLQKTTSITKALDNRGEKLSAYMEFIDKNNILNKTLGELIYTDPHDQSIFSNKSGLPTNFPQLTGGLNPVILKRILRVLVSGVDRYPATDIEGTTHTQQYKVWVLTKTEADKVKDEDWKKKKITDITSDIAKKF